MAIDEATRHRVFGRIEEVLGEEVAATLMSHMPPINWADIATKQDLVLLKQDLDVFRRDLENVEQRLDGKLGNLDDKIDVLEIRLKAEMDSRFARQTRTLVVASTGQMIAFAGLLFAAVRLA